MDKKMKVALITALMVFGSVFISYGQIDKATAEQQYIWSSTIQPFLRAFYGSDYNKAWDIGEEAYRNHPHSFDSKKDFVEHLKDYDKGHQDGKAIVSRNLTNMNLNRVDIMPDGEYFYVTTFYDVTTEDIQTGIKVTCKRMEHILFRVQANSEDFDRFIGIGDTPLECRFDNTVNASIRQQQL
ncbi:MAG: hypothetical protein V3S46_01910 [Nitrospinota bacterium]